MKELFAKRAKMVSLFVVSFLLPSLALAFTAPTAGDFGYEVYDIVVNEILQGPIGFVGAVALIIWSATKITSGNYMLPITGIIAGTIIIKAEAFVTTLGYMV